MLLLPRSCISLRVHLAASLLLHAQVLTPFGRVSLAASIFSVEIVMRFCTGIVIVNRMRRALIMDRRIVALHYVLHGPFLLDLAVVATLWAEVCLRCPVDECMHSCPELCVPSGA